MVSKPAPMGLATALAASFVLFSPATWGQTQRPVDVPCRTSWKAHDGVVWKLSLSMDGSEVATSGHEDGTTKFWNFPSLVEHRRFEQDLLPGKVKIWDVKSSTERRLIKELPIDRILAYTNPKALDFALSKGYNVSDSRHRILKRPLLIAAEILYDNDRIVLDVSNYQQLVTPFLLLDYCLESGECKTISSTGRWDKSGFHGVGPKRLSADRTFLVFRHGNTYSNISGDKICLYDFKKKKRVNCSLEKSAWLLEEFSYQNYHVLWR